jgi:hypothetical protein
VAPPQPRIVFCTTCKGRVNHIAQTLPRNLLDNQDYGPLTFLLVNYASAGVQGENDDLVEYIRSHHMNSVRSGRLVFYDYPDNGPFKMAHAKNLSHRLGIREGADILVNLDADNFTHPGFADYIAHQFQRHGNNIFIWAGIVQGKGRRFRGCSGRISVTANAFLKAGGYDERWDTWSPDDKDFLARLERLGYHAHEMDQSYLESVPHGDGVRFREYPHANVDRSEEGPFGDVSFSIANCGRVGCGTVHRNFSYQSIELGTLPTRIFGIGLHRTATKSLNAALNILGFDSTHWGTPRKAKAIWDEMNIHGLASGYHGMRSSRTLEEHYATMDLPIPLMYRELDWSYPNSKFILTVRDEGKWLESVRKHWDYLQNPWRESWDNDCFTHRIHTELYGRKEFDPEIFLARYRRHNAEVKEYFRRNTPGKLLVLDVAKGDGWRELCGFLDKPIPSVPYPMVMSKEGS